MASKTDTARRIASRLQEWIPPREIFLRTDGKVRFLRISSGAQLSAIAALVTVLLLWLGLTLSMLWTQASMATERSALAKHSSQVARQQAQVNAYRSSVDEVARDIEARQDALDRLVTEHLGTPSPDTSTSAKAPASTTEPAQKRQTSAAPSTERLEEMQSRQQAFETQLLAAAQGRIQRIEKAIRELGVNPSHIASTRSGSVRKRGQAMGGPFIPARGQAGEASGLRNLSAVLVRLSALEAGLAGMPSGRPTLAPMETSSYGYRRDPFNGLAAFHAGIDFPGSYGQSIQSAADGQVSFVGTRNGYGNVVEVDHGNGFMTRYAHLSRFAARAGERVVRGQQIGSMGSTGRSTGTHLHFEVRVNGAAVNPRPFLEARQDVLEVQQFAQQRRAIGG